MMIVLFSLIALLLIIILLFLLPQAIISVKGKLIDRFYLGRIQTEALWQDKVLSICKKWALVTPTVDRSDSGPALSKLVLKNRRKDSIQVWQTASLYLALKEYTSFTPDESVERILHQMQKKAEKEYSFTSLQDSEYGMLAFAMYDSKNSDQLKEAVLEYVKKYTTKDGIICYKSKTPSTAFVDTLGFICPFLTRYGISKKDDTYIDLAKKQLEAYFLYGVEKNCGLPFHAFSISSHIQRGICDWARGLAWLLIGLMDSYQALRGAGREDEFLLSKIRFYADLLVKYQNKTGGFSWQLLSKGIADSSATAVFGWYLALSYQLFNESVYLDCAKNCRSFLMMQTRNNGIIDYCQGDTIGIGIYSRSFGKMPFAQAFALRMQTALRRIE